MSAESDLVGGYFDYNATAPVRPEVVEAISRVLSDATGNPSSMHAYGRRARALIDRARHQAASLVGAKPRSVVFTSGATEANALVIGGLACAGRKLVVSRADHASVLANAERWASDGFRVERVGVDESGAPQVDALAGAASGSTSLVSVAWANSETGAVTDVDALALALDRQAGDLPPGERAPGERDPEDRDPQERASEKRSSGDRGPLTLLHLDAAQAVGRVPVHLPSANAALTFSGHKLGGISGAGAAVLGDGVADQLKPMMVGGSQEDSLRAGTENLLGIVALGVAAETAGNQLEAESHRQRELRELLWQQVSREDGVRRISPVGGLPNTLTFAVRGMESQTMIAALDLDGFALSTGSACAAASPEPSHVMEAIGLDPEYRGGVLRASLGFATTREQVLGLAASLHTVLGRRRAA